MTVELTDFEVETVQEALTRLKSGLWTSVCADELGSRDYGDVCAIVDVVRNIVGKPGSE